MTSGARPRDHAREARQHRAASPVDHRLLEAWAALALCGGFALGWVLQRLIPDPNGGLPLGPDWLPPAAAAVAAVSLVLGFSRPAPRVLSALRWVAVLLLVWVANGLPFDLLTMAGLMGHREPSGAVVMSTVYWPGLGTRACAIGAAVLVAHLALASRARGAPARPATWYGYAAFALALPYPVLRLHWALGGTLGLSRPGAAGEGWEPLLIAVPWVAAAVLSLLLVTPRPWLPRRLLLAGGWSATVIVAMIGPAAIWSLIDARATGGGETPTDIAEWVFALFYGSWFLWALAGGAATRSYQLRSAAATDA